MLPSNIEDEVSKILERSEGWLRVEQCAKLYARDPYTGIINGTKRTNFYRWRKKVEKGKILGFQLVVLPHISFIGLKSADPKKLESLISKNSKVTRSGSGFFEYLKWRRIYGDEQRDKRMRELQVEDAVLHEEMEMNPEVMTPEEKAKTRRKYRKLYGL